MLAKILPTYIVCFAVLPKILAELECDSFSCSLVYDPVCGSEKTRDDSYSIKIYQNICTLLHIGCEKAANMTVVKQVPDELCRLHKQPEDRFINGRRVADFGIVGAHQICNHTCPTYCMDTYDPACAMIYYYEDNELDIVSRPMINHCHVDLFSCSMGLNVTIEPLSKCYSNPSGLMFMSQVAGLKSLGLLDEGSSEAARKGRRVLAKSWRRFLNDFRRNHKRKRK